MTPLTLGMHTEIASVRPGDAGIASSTARTTPPDRGVRHRIWIGRGSASDGEVGGIVSDRAWDLYPSVRSVVASCVRK
jgi:hypothetical protein